MRVVRAPGGAGSRAGDGRLGGAKGVRRRRASTWRSSSSGRATSRSRCSPTGSARSTSASASARSSAGTRSWWRRRPSPAVTPELREWMGSAAVAAARGGGLSRARAPASSCSRAGRLVLLPRDEHPDPGGAPGHRAGLRRGPGAGAAPHRARASRCGCPARWLQPRGWAMRVPDHQRGSRPTASCRPPAESSTCAFRAAPASAGTAASRPGTR